MKTCPRCHGSQSVIFFCANEGCPGKDLWQGSENIGTKVEHGIGDQKHLLQNRRYRHRQFVLQPQKGGDSNRPVIPITNSTDVTGSDSVTGAGASVITPIPTSPTKGDIATMWLAVAACVLVAVYFGIITFGLLFL